ncbi:MAG: hypothetical protein IPG43_18420 [Proteobacteria bacterium]|nr:hypothetical protein [Pseudomonadota bacterium]
MKQDAYVVGVGMTRFAKQHGPYPEIPDRRGGASRARRRGYRPTRAAGGLMATAGTAITVGQ